MQCRRGQPVLGFVCEPRFTILVDLEQTGDLLLAGCRKTTRNEIRRAEKEGVTCSDAVDTETFRSFFNIFAAVRKLPALRPEHLLSFGNDLPITCAQFEGHALAMHAYVMDKAVSRVRLLYSAIRTDDTVAGPVIGWANRFLHFQDMLHFQRLGLRHYDLGGYSKLTDDPALERISQFKASFGGSIVEEYDYLSWPLYLARGFLSRAAVVGRG